jgi:ribose transport system substrate-binding protein
MQHTLPTAIQKRLGTVANPKQFKRDRFSGLTGLIAAAALIASTAIRPVFAEQSFMAGCYRPTSAETPLLTHPKKDGPYRVALVNGFFGIPWRIQMIQSLKSWAARPDVAKDIRELKIVSTGADVAAQLAAVDNFIQAGFDAIIFIAVNPSAFDAVAKRADRAGTLLVSFDNTVDNPKIVAIQPSQIELEGIKATAVLKLMNKTSGKVIEVRGLPGNATDRDRHLGARKVLEQNKDIQVIEVVGNWDTGTVQKVVSDAIATHGQVDGIVVQHGSAGAVNALLASNHPMVPVGGDGENGFRMALAKNRAPGVSVEGSPGMSAVAMQAAIAMLKGAAIPSSVHLPIPPVFASELKADVNYFPELPATFNTVTGYAECGITFTPTELSGQSPDNQ